MRGRVWKIVPIILPGLDRCGGLLLIQARHSIRQVSSKSKIESKRKASGRRRADTYDRVRERERITASEVHGP
jgi:hypothetical protein